VTRPIERDPIRAETVADDLLRITIGTRMVMDAIQNITGR
jgi:hypothetical protein